MTTGENERRRFLKGLLAASLGGLAVAVPAGAGLAVIVDPLRRPAAGAGWAKITPLANLPADGVPRRFVVVADRVNAWTKTPAVPVGAVYLRRTAEREVQAFNVVCPHAGCLVDYAPETSGFLCPCHNSTFGLDGARKDPGSPSPRGLDALDVELRDDGQVWVRFQNFLTGTREKVPA